MPDQIIVATFDNTNSAYDAATALKGLKDKGITDFKPKAGVMVKKDDKGNLSLIEAKDRPLWGTGIGTLGGALIGLIGGAPGAAIGAAIGAMSGLTGDAVTEALDSDFVDSVTKDMKGSILRKVVVDKTRSSLESALASIKRSVEQSAPRR